MRNGKEEISIIVNCNELFHSAKKHIGGAICYETLMNSIKDGRFVRSSHALVYGDLDDQVGFSVMLKSVGLIPFANFDVGVLDREFAKRMIDLAPEVDTLVIVTKNDAHGAIIEFLETIGCKPKIELWFFPSDLPKLLTEDVDEVRIIDENYLYKKGAKAQ